MFKPYLICPSRTSATFAKQASIPAGFLPPACAMFGRPPPPPPTTGAISLIRFPAVQAVAYCDKLFSYEREYKEKGLSYKQRYNRRLKNAKPVIEAFWAWLDTQHAGDNAKFNTALTYVNNRRNQLMTYPETHKHQQHL